MYKNQKTILFLYLFLQFICFAHAQSTTKPITKESTIEQSILAEVNIYRKKYHLSPLTMNSSISKQAKNHSNEMATHKVPFGHQHFFKRVAILRKEIKDTGAISENVAYNYKDAHDVVKNWMLSPGHKKNILGNYTLTGVGIARDRQGKIHFTQMFVKIEPPKTKRTPRYATRVTPFSSFSIGPIFKRITS